jgi:hypothetical protein
MGLGTLDEVPQHYPPRDTSNDAAQLVALAALAEVDLSPSSRRRPDWPWLSAYVEKQLTRADNGIDPPPPELLQYFARNDAALARVRAYLAGRAAIVWPVDVAATTQAPLPNMYGHLALTRLLVAHSLTSPLTASDDLRAAWHLQRALWHRPEMISKQVALAGTRMINAAARRLDAKPAWFDEMRTIDYRRSMLAAQQAEAWAHRRNVENLAEQRGRIDSAHDLVDMALQPWDEMCAANFAAVARGAAAELAQSRDCAVDARALDRRVRGMLPFWNRRSWYALPNLGGVWQRVARFQAELEVTERVFAIKSGQWTPELERSACADGTWSFAGGTLRFSREVPAPRPMLNVPLTYTRP